MSLSAGGDVVAARPVSVRVTALARRSSASGTRSMRPAVWLDRACVRNGSESTGVGERAPRLGAVGRTSAALVGLLQPRGDPLDSLWAHRGDSVGFVSEEYDLGP